MYKPKPHHDCDMLAAHRLNVRVLNGSLKHAPAISNTEEVAGEALESMVEDAEITSEVIRLSDRTIPVGLGYRESSDDD